MHPCFAKEQRTSESRKKNAQIPTHNPKGQKQQKSPRPQRNQHQNPRQKQPRSNKQGGIHSRRLAIPIGLPLIHGQNHCVVNHYPRRTRRLRFPRSSRPAPTAVCFSPSAAATTAPCAIFIHTPGATFIRHPLNSSSQRRLRPRIRNLARHCMPCRHRCASCRDKVTPLATQPRADSLP